MRRLISAQMCMVVVLNSIGVVGFVGCSKKVLSVPDPVIADMPVKAPERPVKTGGVAVMPYAVAKPEAAGEVRRATLYFGFDSFVPAVQEFMKLDGMDFAGRVVRVTGGACEIGDLDYNYALGMKRGLAARAYILALCPDADVRVRSVGELDPVTTDPAQYHLNRRCVVEVE